MVGPVGRGASSSRAEGDDELARTAVAFNDLLDTLHEEHRFRSLVQAGADMTCLVDAAGLVTFISSSVTEVLGWPPDRALGRPIRDLLHPEDADRFTEGDSGPVIVRMIAGIGTWHHLEVTCRDHRDDVTIGTLVITARDVSERHALQQRLAHQAAHDQLTGLPNRSALLAAGAELLGAAGEPVAVLLLDLDQFKEINDTLGPPTGTSCSICSDHGSSAPCATPNIARPPRRGRVRGAALRPTPSKRRWRRQQALEALHAPFDCRRSTSRSTAASESRLLATGRTPSAAPAATWPCTPPSD